MSTLNKILPTICLIAFLILCVSVTLVQANSQIDRNSNYSLDWWTADAGGGRLSAGNFTLEGTIGQPDAAIIKNGSYVLEGGFWSGFESTHSIFLPMVRK
jgi:hypothetical protein